MKDLSTPNPKSRQKLSKKNGIKLVGYSFRLKNYVKNLPLLSDFSELALRLISGALAGSQNFQTFLVCHPLSAFSFFRTNESQNSVSESHKCTKSILQWNVNYGPESNVHLCEPLTDELTI